MDLTFRELADVFVEEDRAVGAVIVYLHPGYADWEIAYIMPLLTEVAYPVQTVAETTEPVRSVGGLTVLPDTDLANLRIDSLDLLLLPGGKSWEVPSEHTAILKLAHEHLDGGGMVAAICGATYGLGRAGLLEGRAHTSNGLELLKSNASEYVGELLYRDEPAVHDHGLITASGLAAPEFSTTIMEVLGLYSREQASEWLGLHRGGQGG